MKMTPLLRKFSFLLLLLTFITACSKNDDSGTSPENDENASPPDNNDGDTNSENDEDNNETATLNIVQLISEEENLSLLGEAIEAADLSSVLNGDGPFTVFAPNNNAIEALFELLGDDYNSFADFDTFFEEQLLEQILLYHVVPQQIKSTDLGEGSVATSLPDETLEIILSEGNFVIGDASSVNANILRTDLEATNGIVHEIDKILIPQEVQDFLEDLGIDTGGDDMGGDDMNGELLTISELVTSNPNLEFLEQALELTGLLEALNGDGPFTVFAPSNDTLIYLAGLVGNNTTKIEDYDTEEKIDILRRVLLYHVVAGEVPSSELMVGEITTLLGDTIEVVRRNDELVLQDEFIWDVKLNATDIQAKNGIIHVIDRILVPESVIDDVLTDSEENIITLIKSLRDNEMLMMALYLMRDRIEYALDNTAPFTLFLPTNKAFLYLFEDLEGIDSLDDFDTKEELQLLGTILGHHLIVAAKAKSTDLSDGQTFETAQGEEITISLANGVQIIDGAGGTSSVTSPNIEILNGVVHIIDRVLLPEEAVNEVH